MSHFSRITTTAVIATALSAFSTAAFAQDNVDTALTAPAVETTQAVATTLTETTVATPIAAGVTDSVTLYTPKSKTAVLAAGDKEGAFGLSEGIIVSLAVAAQIAAVVAISSDDDDDDSISS